MWAKGIRIQHQKATSGGSPALISLPSLQRSASNGKEEGVCLVSDREAKICTAGTLARWGAQGSTTRGCAELAGSHPETPHTSQHPHLNLNLARVSFQPAECLMA